MPSTASVSAKYVCTDRPPQPIWSLASFQPAMISSGTSTAVRTTSASAMPSTPRMYPVPNDGIHVWDSTNWYWSPPGLNPTATTNVTPRTAIEISSASHLATVRCEAGSSMTSAAPTIGIAHRTVSQGKVVTTAAPPGSRRPRRAAPANIDRAYERAKPVCSCRNPFETRPTSAASPFAAPSTASSSISTRPLVRSCPGRMNTRSLNASP